MRVLYGMLAVGAIAACSGEPTLSSDEAKETSNAVISREYNINNLSDLKVTTRENDDSWTVVYDPVDDNSLGGPFTVNVDKVSGKVISFSWLPIENQTAPDRREFRDSSISKVRLMPAMPPPRNELFIHFDLGGLLALMKATEAAIETGRGRLELGSGIVVLSGFASFSKVTLTFSDPAGGGLALAA